MDMQGSSGSSLIDNVGRGYTLDCNIRQSSCNQTGVKEVEERDDTIWRLCMHHAQRVDFRTTTVGRLSLQEMKIISRML